MRLEKIEDGGWSTSIRQDVSTLFEITDCGDFYLLSVFTFPLRFNLSTSLDKLKLNDLVKLKESFPEGSLRYMKFTTDFYTLTSETNEETSLNLDEVMDWSRKGYLAEGIKAMITGQGLDSIPTSCFLVKPPGQAEWFYPKRG